MLANSATLNSSGAKPSAERNHYKLSGSDSVLICFSKITPPGFSGWEGGGVCEKAGHSCGFGSSESREVPEITLQKEQPE